MNKRTLGTEKEKLARAYLEKRGVRILEENFRIRQGEIDLIGIHQKTLVFFEVKYRKNKNYGRPEEAVGMHKQLQICKVAAFYRVFHKVPENFPCRYDVIAICGEEILWIQNAFEQTGF